MAAGCNSLTIIRNALAHHRRFWNAVFPFAPPKVRKYVPGFLAGVQTPYATFVLIMAFLNALGSHSHWGERLAAHLATCPLDYHRHMRFPLDWRTLPPWR